MLIGGVLIALSVALGVVSVGITAIDAQGSVRKRRKEPAPKRQTFGSNGAFTPLDLGPSRMVWPSEQPWQMKGLPKLPWPSETWPDGPFTRSAAGSPPPQADAPEASAKPKPKPQKQPAKGTAAPKKPPRPPAPPDPAEQQFFATVGTPAPLPGDVPSAEQVLAWADAEGLAAAVEKIRSRTGWEFRQAAEHLASAMRARRSR